MITFLEEVIVSAVIAAAWTSFYGGGITEDVIATLSGALVTILAKYLKILAPNEMVLNFLLSFFVASLAYVCASVGITQDYGKIIIGNIMLLVPGVAFVNAIRDIADTDFLSGLVRMIDALLVFVYIAIGVGVTLSIYNTMMGGILR